MAIAGPVFVDTTHWIAVFSPKDNHHDRAMVVGARMSGAALWTTELVLIEFLTHFAGRGSHLRSGAVQTVDSLRRHPKINIVPLIETPFDAAYDEYRRFSDKGWSLTDCASFLLMRQKGISMAAAYDGHFEQARFVVAE